MSVGKAAVKYYQLDSRAPKLMKFFERAAIAKSLISATEIVTNFPKALKALSSKVEKVGPRRIYHTINWNPFDTAQNASDFTLTEVVFKQLHEVAIWFLSVSDFMNELSEYFEQKNPKSLINRVASNIHLSAGLYMCIQELYEESVYAYELWFKNDKEIRPIENYLILINVAASLSFLAFSTLKVVGLFWGEQAKEASYYKRCSLLFTVATTVMPMVQTYFKENKTI